MKFFMSNFSTGSSSFVQVLFQNSQWLQVFAPQEQQRTPDLDQSTAVLGITQSLNQTEAPGHREIFWAP